METVELSAIIITKNEAQNIKRCLDSIQWIPNIVIVDGFSSDRTPEYAQSYPNVHFVQHEWMGYSKTKEYATSLTKFEWVFWIDADEEVTDRLAQNILSAVQDNRSNIAAYEMPRDTFFMGEIVRHCGWSGDVTRLFNKSRCQFDGKELHEGLECLDKKDRIERLKGSLNHYSYQSLYQYFAKMNDYGRGGALELQRKGKAISIPVIFFNTVFTFCRAFFLKGGFLDGRKGFIISMGSAFSNFIKYTNYYYLKRSATGIQPSQASK